MNILPIWKSHYSLGRSILTVDKEHSPNPSGSKSLLCLAKENGIKDVVLVEDNFSSCLEVLKNCKALDLNIQYGIRFVIADDATEKNEASLKNESKIILFIKNNQGYKDLIRLWAYANEVGFYYQPRIDWKTLCEMVTPNILVALPFYDSFIFNNNLTFAQIVPQLNCDSIDKVIFFEESNQLPFDNIISGKLKEYVKADDRFSIQKAQSIFYEKEEDFMAYMTFRCINNQSKLSKPELSHMSSNTFSFEQWKITNGQ
jgi:DNA polymerase III alpha subunit